MIQRSKVVKKGRNFMSIPPIERVLVPPKSQEASQFQHAQTQKQTHAQEQLGVQYNNMLRHNSEQTVKMTKSENNEYRYDAREKGNGNFSGKKKGKKKQEQNDTEKEKTEIRMSNFDMRI